MNEQRVQFAKSLDYQLRVNEKQMEMMIHERVKL